MDEEPIGITAELGELWVLSGCGCAAPEPIVNREPTGLDSSNMRGGVFVMSKHRRPNAVMRLAKRNVRHAFHLVDQVVNLVQEVWGLKIEARP